MTAPPTLTRDRLCSRCASPELNLVEVFEKTTPVLWVSQGSGWVKRERTVVSEVITQRLECCYCGTEHAVPKGEGL